MQKEFKFFTNKYLFLRKKFGAHSCYDPPFFILFAIPEIRPCTLVIILFFFFFIYTLSSNLCTFVCLRPAGLSEYSCNGGIITVFRGRGANQKHFFCQTGIYLHFFFFPAGLKLLTFPGYVLPFYLL